VIDKPENEIGARVRRYNPRWKGILGFIDLGSEFQ
jgi:hypothetical protein